MGFPDEEYKIGSSGELFKYYGFTAENIAEQIIRLVKGV
jgi:transketolase C-terminal domain/subunit